MDARQGEDYYRRICIWSQLPGHAVMWVVVGDGTVSKEGAGNRGITLEVHLEVVQYSRNSGVLT